ncbi:MAG: NAD(P)-dependent oxidoreductase [Parachlamydiales bacterium]|nr:NAD(P)-dependent oxidoreductase [Parachlamydiales bacterium]
MKIAILGAGYIGSDVAALWTKKGHQVTATTRHPDRLADLSRVAQKCVIFKGNDENELASLILNNDTILVTISADLPDEFEETYLQMAHAIRRVALDRSPPRRLIYTSSTAIYGDHRGLWVDESSKLKLKSEQGRILIETERVFLSLEDLGWHVCILRVSEIYGPLRELSHRLRALQGQTLPGSGKNYSNMIHRADVTSAVDYALRRRLEGVYNLADDDHPTRRDLYDQIAAKLGLPSIQWNPGDASWRGGNKRISNHKIKKLGFKFRYPHRIID